jgi:peptidoglycan-associated lipoprotein
MDEICDAGMCVFSGDYDSADGASDPCNLGAVYFGFNSPTLSSETQDALKTAAECIKNQPGMYILEAHADPRGTEEYNIMLTDRRGQSVKEFLGTLGVGPDKLQVISKGSLEATGTDEGSMKNDRRVEFIAQ